MAAIQNQISILNSAQQDAQQRISKIKLDLESALEKSPGVDLQQYAESLSQSRDRVSSVAETLTNLQFKLERLESKLKIEAAQEQQDIENASS